MSKVSAATKGVRFAAWALFSMLATGCLPLSIALSPAPITVATGTPGGIYHPVGNAICRMYNLERDEQDLPCVAVSSQGSVENIQRIQRNETTFSLSQTDIAYAAFHGEGPFIAKGGDRSIRMLLGLYPDVFTVVARADSGIRDFADLRGRRVGIGSSGAGYNFTRKIILSYYTPSNDGRAIADPADMPELSPTDQNQALCSNKVDAIIFSGGQPNGLIQEVTTACPTKLVRVAGPEVNRLLAEHKYYRTAVIPGGMYDGNAADVPTIGSEAVLVTSSNTSDELAYAVVRAVMENFADFQRMHPALAMVKMTDLVPSQSVIPIHPGAMKYFREIGLAP